ncbi:MAG TPA: acyl-CoA dehydrogenase family protein [Acidimicrobiia bacterium]|nr:acyl-CoA dehydrogenase family protein [Acidimicrobiia bacterium]
MDVTVPPIPPAYDGYRERVRAFVAEHRPDLGWTPRAGMRVPDDEADVEKLRAWVRALYDAGFAVDPPDGRGDEFESRILREELGRAGVPYVLGNPLVAGALRLFGTDEQRRTYLPPIARGDHIWTQLFSEPDAGSDLASLTTRADRDGDHFAVNGQKVWSTWAQFADFGYLLARTEPVAGPAGITAFILDMRTPGVTTRPLREMTGTSDFNEVFLDDVRIPAGNVIGEPGQGWRVATASLATERGGVGLGGTADAVAALVGMARRYRRGGAPAIEDSAVRQDIARFAARSRIQRALGYRVATKAAAGTVDAWDAPLTKIWYSELNLELCEYAMALQGPVGALVEGEPLAHDSGRWQDAFLYARAYTIAGGSNEIMRNLIAERGLGLPREARGS